MVMRGTVRYLLYISRVNTEGKISKNEFGKRPFKNLFLYALLDLFSSSRRRIAQP